LHERIIRLKRRFKKIIVNEQRRNKNALLKGLINKYG